MYIEFLGIPGCGKTYHAGIYKLQLIKEGKKIIDLSRQKTMPFWLKLFYKLAELCLLKLPKYRRMTQEYAEACKECTDKPSFLPFSLQYCIKDIVLASLLHDIFRNKNIIFISDEGQLQRMVFLILQYEVSYDKVMSIYNKYRDSNIRTIYIRNDVETSIKNIRLRNRHVCPMDELKEDKLTMYLNSFYSICEMLKKDCQNNFSIKNVSI